jgi:hypothetical protein
MSCGEVKEVFVPLGTIAVNVGVADAGIKRLIMY